MQDSKIEWTDKTWNPVTGCTKVSQGCKNCYAERMYERFNGKGSFKNVQMHPEKLSEPLKWRNPARIFVNSMSDLFHESVTFDFIDMVFAVMALCPQHTFQVLTKRSARMLEYFKSREDYEQIEEAAAVIVSVHADQCFVQERRKIDGKFCSFPSNKLKQHITDAGWYSHVTFVDLGDGDYDKEHEFIYEGTRPFPNIWIGVSVENMDVAERMEHLAEVDAAVKFLSCEPLLGPIELPIDASDGSCFFDWIIVGGESGPGARPMHPDWVRSVRDQCAMNGAAFFFKQWGEYAPEWANKRVSVVYKGIGYEMGKLGKKKAGRLLDGNEYNAFPQTPF